MFLLIVKDTLSGATIKKYEGFDGFMSFRDKDILPLLSKHGRITLEVQKTKETPELEI